MTEMSFPLILSTVLLASVPTADGTITNAAELTRVSYAGVKSPHPFDIRATALSRPDNSMDAFSVRDASGTVAIRIGWNRPNRDFNPGDELHLTGHVEYKRDVFASPFASSIVVLRHGARPDPVDATAGEILTGRYTNELVRVTGTVVDAFRDEVDPRFVFLALACGHEILTVASEGVSPDDAGRLTDATVSCIGTVSHYRDVGPRRRLGFELNVRRMDDIRVLRPAPVDPFDVPELTGLIHDITHPDATGPRRRRIRGKVVAVRAKSQLLLQTRDDFSTVALAGGEPPACGETVEAAGLPETDFYHLNLSRAVWRKASPLALPELKPVARSAAQLLTDGRGRRKFDIRSHGQVVRLVGTVRDLPAPANGNGVFSILSDGFLVSVDASAAPDALAGLGAGAEIEVTGACFMATDNWRPQAPFPHIREMEIVLRAADGVRVLRPAPWWTRERLFAALGILLAVIAGILVWNAALRRLATRKGRELMREQIGHVRAELQTAERTRLATELHDSLAQNLTGVSLQIDTAARVSNTDPAAMRLHLDTAARALKSCRDELRNCLWDLRSRSLEERTMDAAIRKTLAPHATGADIAIRFNVPRDRLTDSTAHAILCMVRELTLNGIRHGGATRVRIAGCVDAGRLLFSVQDNGSGFDPDRAPGFDEGHYGLVGIRERIEELDGEFTLDSAPGRGVKATVALTMPQEKDE